MNDVETETINGIQFDFENIAPNTEYHGSESVITWKQLKDKFIRFFCDEKGLSILAKRQIKRIEIGSIAWFHYRNKKHGRFFALNTMFYARLLKR